MKFKNTISAISIFFLILIGIYSCKKECNDSSNPDCKNYNPCMGKKETSAYFIIEERLGYSTPEPVYWIECDTVYGYGNNSAIRFTAMQDADSFIWTIGKETINLKTFIRNGFPKDRHIPVRLIVFNKNTDIGCFPNDNGIDTFYRDLYTWPEESFYDQANEKYVTNNPMPIQGKYRGYYESKPNNEIEITIHDTSYYCVGNSNSKPTSENIPFGNFTPSNGDKYCGYFTGFGWKKVPTAALLQFRSYPLNEYADFHKDSIKIINGFMQLSRDLKNLDMDIEYYQIWDYTKSQLKKDKFHGIKIN